MTAVTAKYSQISLLCHPELCHPEPRHPERKGSLLRLRRSGESSYPYPLMRARRTYCVYIMGSLSGTLYIGIDWLLHKRAAFEHKFHRIEGFADGRLRCRASAPSGKSYDEVHKAIGREKQLKGWRRENKIVLIYFMNPQWVDLSRDWYPWMKQREVRGASTAGQSVASDRSFSAQHDKG